MLSYIVQKFKEYFKKLHIF